MIETGLGAIDAYPASVSGWWWLPHRPGHKVRATLKIDVTGQAELASSPDVAPAGWFAEPSEQTQRPENFYATVIHGRTTPYDRPVSLIACRVFGSNAGKWTLAADCEVVVDGLWLTAVHQEVFSELQLQLEHLTSWDARTTFILEPGSAAGAIEKLEPVVWVHPHLTLRSVLADGRVVSLERAIHYGSERSEADTATRMSENAFFRVAWPERPVSLADAIAVASVLQDLITFATSRASAFIRIQLTAHDSVVTEVADPSSPKPHARIHLRGRATANRDLKHVAAAQMLFNRNDIDFSDFMSRWFTIHNQYRPVVATVLGQRYLSEQYAEVRLAMVVAAAEQTFRAAGFDETFMTGSARDKVRTKIRAALRGHQHSEATIRRISEQIDNHLRLEERLLRLVQDVGELADRFVGQRRKAWVTAVKNARNMVAHTSGAKDLSGYQLTMLMLSTRLIIEFTLLRQLGFSPQTLTRIADRHPDRVYIRDGLDWLDEAEDDTDQDPTLSDTHDPYVTALCEHIERVDVRVSVISRRGYNHIGAILADAILQAAMRYDTVRSRALAFRSTYPSADTITGVLALGGPDTLSGILDWSGAKPQRIHALAVHLNGRNVDTVEQLSRFLANPENIAGLRAIPGIGPKTADYLCILVGHSTAAVDTHLRSFAAAAGLPNLGYSELHQCYIRAAESLGVDVRDLDHAVWRHVSGR